MFTCVFCGWQAANEAARICAECGPAKNWPMESVDRPEAVRNYLEIIREFFFDSHTAQEVEKFSLRARERLKISLDTHRELLAGLQDERDAMAGLSHFKLEFDTNVVDAYAGHDTYLRFRFTNLSDTDLYKVNLDWDDPELPDELDLHIASKVSVKPGVSAVLGGSHVFSRMGIKEIADLRVTVTNQFQESASFRAGAFTFKVGNPEQRVTNLTHNQISIEGRGVVDASGMGAQAGAKAGPQDAWIELPCTYVSSDVAASPEVSRLPQPPVPHATEAAPAKAVSDAHVAVHEPAPEADEMIDPENFASLRRHAERGNREARYLLGESYLAGRGVPVNPERALEWFMKAAEEGCDKSLQCAEWICQAAQYALGKAYAEGRGVIKDPALAIDWFKRGAAAGCAHSQNYLGYLYQMGTAVPRDDGAALVWFQRAATQGLAAAERNLGVMYEYGFGITKDARAAAEWYLKASQKGDARAQVQLGLLYEDGDGVPEDAALAAGWYGKAAAQGNIDGLSNLGRCQLFGTGLPADPAKAVVNLRKAAEGGDIIAQYHLASCLQNGNGIPRDLSEAAAWYTKAAAQGDADAQYELGNMYLLGQGVEQDEPLARSWLQKAADQGHEDAKSDLTEMGAVAGAENPEADTAGNMQATAMEPARTLRDDVKYLVALLEELNNDSSSGCSVHDCGSSVSSDLRESLFLIVTDPDREDVCGVAVEDDDSCVLDSQGRLTGFAGTFTVFSTEGYTWGHTDDDGDLLVDGQCAWKDAGMSDLVQFWRFRHDKLNYTIYLGEQAENTYLSGAKFEFSGHDVDGYWHTYLEAILALKTLLFHAAYGVQDVRQIDLGDGRSYVGELDVVNDPYGYGTMTYADGSSFEGLFEDGEFVMGTYKFANGAEYVGEWSGSVRHGFGIERYAGDWDGHEYYGEFVNNERHGEGLYRYPDGSEQAGKFENGRFVG